MSATSSPTGASQLCFAPVRPHSPEHVSRKEEPIVLPETSIEDILTILSGAFYEQTGLDLATREEALALFRSEAERARTQLQERDAVLIELDQVLGTYFFQFLVQRETVLALQDLHAAGRQTHSGSVRGGTYLPLGYFALPDAGRQRLLIGQSRPEAPMYWQLSLAQFSPCQAPRDAVWLPDLRLLLTNQQTREVVEIALDGRVLWRLDTSASPDLALRAPVRASCYSDAEGQTRYLIVDQGHHRVIEVSADQHVVWQYGMTGQSRDLDGYLDQPSDVHYTPQGTYLIADSGNHRVLEISGQRIVHSFTAADGLDWPVFAERLDNGHTLIVDQLRHTIFEFNAAHARVRKCSFYHPGMDDRFKTGKLAHVVLRDNGNLLISDGERLLEVDYIKQRIVAFTALRQLQPQLFIPVELAEVTTSGQVGKSFGSYEATSGPELVTLRQMLMKVPLFENAPGPQFYEQIEKILRFRSFQAGAEIVEKGKPLKSMYFIQSGEVDLLGEKVHEPVVTLKAGESFGMMGIVYIEPRAASIQARTPCGLYELEKKPFDKLIESYSEIAAKISKLASERLVVAKLKQGQNSEKTQARFQEVLALQKARFAGANAKASDSPAPAVQATVQRASFKPKRPDYSEAQRHLIHEAIDQGQSCFEVHVFLNITCMMKGARAYVIMMVMEKLGTIIHSQPSLEDIQNDQAKSMEVIVTLATTHSLDQVIEDATQISEVNKVEVIALGAEATSRA